MPKTWQLLKKHPELFKRYFLREQIFAVIRQYFIDQNFHEVEVPLLAPALPAESYVEVFESTLLDRHRVPQKAYLTTSPEVFLKKLLVAGIGNCFSLCKSFRNTETFSNTHNPEFSMLEWYHVDADYIDLMVDSERLFVAVAKSLGKSLDLVYQGKHIDLTPPWERLSMVEAFKKYANVELEKNLTQEEIVVTAKAKGYSTENATWEQLFNQIYLNEVEPNLGQGKPTILYDFPSQMAALAKKKTNDPRFAERFEIFIAGLELGDAYSELSDWKEQEDRFKAEVVERKRLGKTFYPYDRDFIAALKVGLPRCAGLALGVDRLVMLFADVARIQDILFFPADEMWKKD